MRIFHLIRRNQVFYYVSRVPVDLQQHFPLNTIQFSLKTKDYAFAAAETGAINSELMLIYSMLRSPMIDAKLASYIVNKFLLARLVKVMQRDQQSPRASLGRRREIEAEEESFNSRGMGLTSMPDRENRAAYLQEKIDELRQDLLCSSGLQQVPDALKRYGKGIKASRTEKTWLGRKLQDAEIEALEIEKEVIILNKARLLPRIGELKRACEGGFMLLSEVIDKFVEYYPTTLKRQDTDAQKDCERECATLLQLVGDLPIATVNGMETLTTLKKALQRMPNRQGGKAEKSKPIKPKTANKYLLRFNTLLKFASDSKYLTTTPLHVRLFPVEEQPDQLRSAYDAEDFSRLADALTKQQLWLRGTNRDERFWSILLAVFQGIESSRIYSIRNEFIKFENDLWKIDSSTWSTAKTIYRRSLDMPVHPDLVSIGFCKWVATLPDGLIFQEKPADFGQWYNRRDKNAKGEALGFECRHVTTDEKKCLYSTRHSHLTSLYEAGADVKAIKDLAGHSIGEKDSTRRHYIKRSSAERLLPELMQHKPFSDEQVKALRLRAAELFNL